MASLTHGAHLRPAMVALLVIACGGCASAATFRIPGAPEYLPISNWRLVEIFEHHDSVPEAFVELANISGEGTALNSRQGLIDAMRRDAAKLGANAIIFEGYDRQGFFSGAINNAPNRESRATAIRIRPDSSDPFASRQERLLERGRENDRRREAEAEAPLSDEGELDCQLKYPPSAYAVSASDSVAARGNPILESPPVGFVAPGATVQVKRSCGEWLNFVHEAFGDVWSQRTWFRPVQ